MRVKYYCLLLGFDSQGISQTTSKTILDVVLISNSICFNYMLQQLVVKAVSLAIARDGASGGVVRTVIVRFLKDLYPIQTSMCEYFIKVKLQQVKRPGFMFDMLFLQINSEGVTRNFYPGDTLPLWHEELEPQNSLLDILNASSPEPMNI